MTDTVQGLRQQLQRLRAQHDSGALGDAEYAAGSAALERRLVDLVVSGAAADAPAQAPAQAAPAAAPARPGGRLWSALGGIALLLAGAGYWWTGSPEQLMPAGLGAATDAAAGDPDTLQREQFTMLAERLAARLKNEPDNAEGWTMLGRSYMALGRQAEGLAAFKHVYELRPDDADVLADYADALAVSNGRELAGEPTALIERALKLDPDNLKALMLAGTAAFNRGDYAKAAQHWDRAAKVGPPGSPLVQQALDAVAEARERGKLPAAVSGDAAPGVGAGGAITGTVTLAPGLRAKVSADDTVFIFARPASGSRMPLAVVRKQVRDLPFAFRLDDSQAMSPATRLSTASSVVVGARISKSGQAAPQAGDLEGISGVTAVGSTGVAVVITGEVK